MADHPMPFLTQQGALPRPGKQKPATALPYPHETHPASSHHPHSKWADVTLGADVSTPTCAKHVGFGPAIDKARVARPPPTGVVAENKQVRVHGTTHTRSQSKRTLAANQNACHHRHNHQAASTAAAHSLQRHSMSPAPPHKLTELAKPVERPCLRCNTQAHQYPQPHRRLAPSSLTEERHRRVSPQSLTSTSHSHRHGHARASAGPRSLSPVLPATPV